LFIVVVHLVNFLAKSNSTWRTKNKRQKNGFSKRRAMANNLKCKKPGNPKSQKDFLLKKNKRTFEGTKNFKICISQASVLLFVGENCKNRFLPDL
jgi:hypothetical protein